MSFYNIIVKGVGKEIHPVEILLLGVDLESWRRGSVSAVHGHTLFSSVLHYTSFVTSAFLHNVQYTFLIPHCLQKGEAQIQG